MRTEMFSVLSLLKKKLLSLAPEEQVVDSQPAMTSPAGALPSRYPYYPQSTRSTPWPESTKIAPKGGIGVQEKRLGLNPVKPQRKPLLGQRRRGHSHPGILAPGWFRLGTMLVMLGSAALVVVSAEHKPRFRWVEGGTTAPSKVPYDFTLLDGDEPIGYFWKERVSFYEYKLIPDAICGFARNKAYGIGLYAQNWDWGEESLSLKQWAVETSDPTRFVMKVHLGQKAKGEPADALDIESSLEVTWDPAIQSYAWTITKKITVLGGRVLSAPFVYGGRVLPNPLIEFEDTYFHGITSACDQQYHFFVWKSADGSLYKMPLNNDKSTDKRDWRYARDGFWVACLTPIMNPALEWLEGHTEDVESVICWLYQDLHNLWLPKNGKFRPGQSKTVKYRFVSYPYDKAKAILDQSRFRDLPGDPIKEFPMREWPLSRFDKNVYRVEKLGLFPWCPSTQYDEWMPQHYDPKCIWDKTTGYDDAFSLKIDAGDGGMHTWRCTAVDYQPSMPIQGKSRFRFIVKTKDLQGYARLVYCNIPPSIPPLASEKISGTHDWTEIVLEVPDGYWRGGNSDLYFEVQGPGMAWIDNLWRESDGPAKPEPAKR